MIHHFFFLLGGRECLEFAIKLREIFGQQLSFLLQLLHPLHGRVQDVGVEVEFGHFHH